MFDYKQCKTTDSYRKGWEKAFSGKQCSCYECLKDVPLIEGSPTTIPMTRMILCPDCGNKRCPKATDHNNECTNSNEPNQKGSRY